MVVGLDIIAGGAGAADPVTEFFTPTPAQTVFNLAQAPADPSDTIMKVNTATYDEGSPTPGYFTVSGTTLTWLDVFQLDSTDEVSVTYFP